MFFEFKMKVKSKEIEGSVYKTKVQINDVAKQTGASSQQPTMLIIGIMLCF